MEEAQKICREISIEFYNLRNQYDEDGKTRIEILRQKLDKKLAEHASEEWAKRIGSGSKVVFEEFDRGLTTAIETGQIDFFN